MHIAYDYLRTCCIRVTTQWVALVKGIEVNVACESV